MADIFDFGFTAVDEDELDAVVETTKAATSYEERLDKLYNAIIPLLNNLKKNPEKEFLKWPNRLEKVEQFETHITNIYQGR
jgi:hypothetical protein